MSGARSIEHCARTPDRFSPAWGLVGQIPPKLGGSEEGRIGALFGHALLNVGLLQHAPECGTENLEHRRGLASRVAGSGLRIVLDCANGATAGVAPHFFRALGFDVTTIGAEPNGRNINLGCGAGIKFGF